MKRIEKQKLLLEEMLTYERQLWEQGYDIVAGVDEVGRGPLAGPVVAAAVVLPQDFSILGINDSKKVTEKKREELFSIIKEEAVAYGIGIVDHQVIDEINILEATKIAMKKAITNLKIDLEKKTGKSLKYILIDALTLDIDVPQMGMVKGDAKSVSIAAASIIAKVTRDHMMIDYDTKYPGYSFASNKGYGTKAHYEGLDSLGMCPIHRKTFLKKYSK